MELVTLTTNELRRLEVVQAINAGTIGQAAAAQILGLSVRQIKRLVRRYRASGPSALASGKRGRISNRALDPDDVEKALGLYATLYRGFGPTLAAEKLRERDGIRISRETLRKRLIERGLWAKSKRRRRLHPPRERRPCFGELVQADGSPHNWFEDRGPRCTLLVAIDDATSRIGAARFVHAETTEGYFELFERYFRKHGLPEAFYVDRHSIFRINTPLLHDRQTQLGRALEELGVELICANSPQAKGRVERANRTLQDRLIKEMRLLGISTLEQANHYLPAFIDAFNAKFSKAPADLFDAHRKTDLIDFDHILCQQTERTLSKNLTFQFGSAIYALRDDYSRAALRPGVRVQIRTQRNGDITITHARKTLECEMVQRIERNPAIVTAKELAARPQKTAPMPQMARTPRPDHPWKRWNPKASRPGDISTLQHGDITVLR